MPGTTTARTTLLVALAIALLSGCGPDLGENVDPDQVDAVKVPEIGACRVLTVDDVAQPTNATRTIDCSSTHTAQTYAVGSLPSDFEDADYDDPELGQFAYQTCGGKLQRFLGADESLTMRTIITWVWFRPSEKAWDDGARWYRCDAIGGNEMNERLLPLPETAEGLLQGRPADRWLVCVAGPSVAEAARIPCSERHDWRAVTTIKLGEADDPYPGDRAVEDQTRDFCSDSVGAWLNYPVDFDYGYTWFREAEWAAGNRRSVCWAKTSD